MTLEKAIKNNPYNANIGNMSAYVRYLRYNVDEFYKLSSEEVRKRYLEYLNKNAEGDDMLFCYSKANAMQGHEYSDDVVICKAKTKKEAIKIFSKMYSEETLLNNVKKVEFNDLGIFVATDY